MTSAVLANQNDHNWSQSRAVGSEGGGRRAFMAKGPYSNSNPNPNPNPKSNKRQFHGEINGFQMEDFPAATQSASDDASSISHHRRSSNGPEFSNYVNFNVSSYTREQLVDLKIRLQVELEQIRNLKGRIEASKLHPINNNLKKSSKTSGHKRPTPPNSGKNLSRSNSEAGNLMKACSQILSKVMKHKHSWIFNKPVDVVGMGLHDYFDIIKHPMDLGSVKSKLGKNVYTSPADFAADVRLTFKNAMAYNPRGHDVHAMAEQLSIIFEELFQPLRKIAEEERQVHPVYDEELQASSWNHVQLERVTKKDNPKHISKKLDSSRAPVQAPASSSHLPLAQSPVKTPSPVRAPPVKALKQPKPKAKDPNKRDMTLEEKHRLGLGLQSLPQEKMDQVVQIIKKRNGHLKQDGDEIELDIEAVDTETLWELDRLVTNWKKMVSKIKRQALMGNMNTTSNKSNGDLPLMEKLEVGTEAKKPRKGEAGEEDVDIGDDEMPMTGFPPVEIEKDAAGGHASSSSSGSSGSSSDDSSSSSGSDTDGSSGSDSDDNARS